MAPSSGISSVRHRKRSTVHHRSVIGIITMTSQQVNTPRATTAQQQRNIRDNITDCGARAPRWASVVSRLTYFLKWCIHHDTVSEWLRRWTRNPLGSAREGSNPFGVAFSLRSEGDFSIFSAGQSGTVDVHRLRWHPSAFGRTHIGRRSHYLELESSEHESLVDVARRTCATCDVRRKIWIRARPHCYPVVWGGCRRGGAEGARGREA